MPTYTIDGVEKIKDMPNAKYGPAKVLKLTLKETEEQPEWFTKVATPDPEVGAKIEGEIEQSNFGPKWKPAGSGGGGGGGFKRSPAETSAIQRQHSQEMALRREQNMIAAGHRPYTGEQLRSVINWFDEDIKGKDRAVKWDGMSDDVPADQEGLPI